MKIFVIFLLYSFFSFARESLPPYIAKGAKSHLATLPCDASTIVDNKNINTKMNYKKMTSVAYNPQYNNIMELKRHGEFLTKVIDNDFQDSPSDRPSNGQYPLPLGWIAHNSVTNIECQDGYYLSSDVNKNNFYARCYNGNMYSCLYEPLSIGANGSTYEGTGDINNRIRGCLESNMENMLYCRRMCDVTKFVDNINYRVETAITQYRDFIGFLSSGEEDYITYYLVKPQNNIEIKCTNNTFLANSTENNKQTQFAVSCNTDGYVEYPNNGVEDPSQGYSTICTSNYACIVPNNDEHLRGTYVDGNFTSVGIVPHGGSLYLYCNGTRSVINQNTISCLNGNLFPDIKYLCENDGK